MQWGINHLQEHHPLFLAKPRLNLQTVKVPPLGNLSPLYLFFMNPLPLKIAFFNEPRDIQVFIVNPILFFKSN